MRLGDVTPKGRLRLDATARYLQDIANDDAVDGAYSDIHGWVVRRTEMWVHQFPLYMKDVSVKTWCGGYGSHWAERRTTITSDDGARIESAALWVHVDMQTMKPTPLPADFLQMIDEASSGRTPAPLCEPMSPVAPGVHPLHLNCSTYWCVWCWSSCGRSCCEDCSP